MAITGTRTIKTTVTQPAKKHTKSKRKGNKVPLGKPNPKIKGLSPSNYFFKRSMQQTFLLSNTATPEGWTSEGNGYYRQFVYSLSNLGDYEDFKNLFSQYKLCAVKMECILSNSSSEDSNGQLLLRWDKGYGAVKTLSEAYFLTSQTARKRVVQNTSAKPIQFYTKLKQLSDVWGGSTNTDYATTKPRWISTDEATTPHYGLNLRIDRVDGQQFGTALNSFQYLKIITTIYVACRKVS